MEYEYEYDRDRLAGLARGSKPGCHRRSEVGCAVARPSGEGGGPIAGEESCSCCDGQHLTDLHTHSASGWFMVTCVRGDCSERLLDESSRGLQVTAHGASGVFGMMRLECFDETGM